MFYVLWLLLLHLAFFCTYVISFHPYLVQPNEVSMIPIPILQMKKLNCREVDSVRDRAGIVYPGSASLKTVYEGTIYRVRSGVTGISKRWD